MSSLFLLIFKNLLSDNLNAILLMFKLIGVANFASSIIILLFKESNIDLHVPTPLNKMVLLKGDTALWLNLACPLTSGP